MSIITVNDQRYKVVVDGADAQMAPAALTALSELVTHVAQTKWISNCPVEVTDKGLSFQEKDITIIGYKDDAIALWDAFAKIFYTQDPLAQSLTQQLEQIPTKLLPLIPDHNKILTNNGKTPLKIKQNKEEFINMATQTITQSTEAQPAGQPLVLEDPASSFEAAPGRLGRAMSWISAKSNRANELISLGFDKVMQNETGFRIALGRDAKAPYALAERFSWAVAKPFEFLAAQFMPSEYEIDTASPAQMAVDVTARGVFTLARVIFLVCAAVARLGAFVVGGILAIVARALMALGQGTAALAVAIKKALTSETAINVYKKLAIAIIILAVIGAIASPFGAAFVFGGTTIGIFVTAHGAQLAFLGLIAAILLRKMRNQDQLIADLRARLAAEAQPSKVAPATPVVDGKAAEAV